MKRLTRLAALAVLGVYVSLVATESLHNLSKNHTDSRCAICQVAHQTPVLSSGQPVVQHHQAFRRITAAAAPLLFTATETTYHGRSPPVL
jgi:hypothetical protein